MLHSVKSTVHNSLKLNTYKLTRSLASLLGAGIDAKLQRYIEVYIHVYMTVFIHVYIQVYIYLYIKVFIFVHMQVYICVHIQVLMNVYQGAGIHPDLCSDVHIYVKVQ